MRLVGFSSRSILKCNSSWFEYGLDYICDFSSIHFGFVCNYLWSTKDGKWQFNEKLMYNRDLSWVIFNVCVGGWLLWNRKKKTLKDLKGPFVHKEIHFSLI